jgi:hypothetical protein
LILCPWNTNKSSLDPQLNLLYRKFTNHSGNMPLKESCNYFWSPSTFQLPISLYTFSIGSLLVSTSWRRHNKLTKPLEDLIILELYCCFWKMINYTCLRNLIKKIDFKLLGKRILSSWIRTFLTALITLGHWWTVILGISDIYSFIEQ